MHSNFSLIPARHLRAWATGAALAAAGACPAAHAQSAARAAAPDARALAERIEQLGRELEALRAALASTGATATAATTATRATAAPLPAPAPAPAPAPEGPATELSGYGEINLNRPRDAAASRADLRRFVLGYAHRFDARTHVAAELEVEHAVASADDSGEVEVEQLFVERRLGDAAGASVGWRAGLMLMPLGLLNENHEPTAYYGVERNFVETAIIPSTWREGGVALFGQAANGWSGTAGLATSFDLSHWDPASTEGREAPLAAIHQELQQARARDLGLFAQLDWRGLPGLRLGASAFTGGAGQGNAELASPHARVTLWDLHARWTPGAWDFSALLARGAIRGAGALNAAFAAAAAGAPFTPVPNRFDGAYVQAAWRLALDGDASLAPFARLESFDTARGADGLGALAPADAGSERVLTLGFNYNLASGVVIKADHQQFRREPSRDRFDLGLGFAF